MTTAAAAMDDVVRRVAPFLRGRAFRKQRHAFARTLETGVVQAILFQMGQFQPAEDRRPGLYGAFTVELGVWFPAVADLLDNPTPKFVRPYDCHVQRRLGFLLDEPEDMWWSLDHPTEEIADAMVEAFDQIGLPWLDSLSTPRDVLAAAAADPEFDDAVLTSTVVPALQYLSGDREAATQQVKRELREMEHRGAAEDLVAWSRELGLPVSRADAPVLGGRDGERVG